MRVKVSANRMRSQYLCDYPIVAIARLEDEVIGHAIAVVRNDKEFTSII